MSIQKINTLLELADNALILGHRISEWCGHGPVLEQDIAITNIALDHLGQARNLYQYIAELANALTIEERTSLFDSIALQEKSDPYTEDDFPYLRDAWDFKNALLVEQPNGNWANTIARSFFYDHFQYLFFKEITQNVSDDNLKAIAEKSLKEVDYHRRWSSEWVIRLGDGTEESHEKMQSALNDLWPYTKELFAGFELDGYRMDVQALKEAWEHQIRKICEEATVTLPPSDVWMHSGGKEGVHSEHLGFILAELQYVQRAYPNMSW